MVAARFGRHGSRQRTERQMGNSTATENYWSSGSADVCGAMVSALNAMSKRQQCLGGGGSLGDGSP
jgi:hypothetical protein